MEAVQTLLQHLDCMHCFPRLLTRDIARHDVDVDHAKLLIRPANWQTVRGSQSLLSTFEECQMHICYERITQ